MDEQSEAGGNRYRKDDVGASREKSMKYADEVWWTGGRSACRKLESSQMKMGKRMLWPS